MTLRRIDSSYRILKILKFLSDKPGTMNEILRELDYEIYPETVSKYFRVLRSYGFIIEKKRHKFELLNMPFFIDFSDSELKSLAAFEVFSKDVASSKQNEKLHSSVRKILAVSPKENRQKYNQFLSELNEKKIFEKYREKIEKITSFFEENPVKIQVIYKKAAHIVTPVELRYKGDKVYLFCFDEAKLTNRQFLLDDIEDVKSMIQKSSKMPFIQKTVFRLNGRVALGYKSPYENEIIEYQDDGSIIVTNSYEDKNLLLKRLLKYFEFCEILSPKADREEFIEMIDNLIESYSRE